MAPTSDEDGKRLLVEINVKLNNLIDRFDQASGGDGFPRCVNRIERIKRLEQDVIAMKQYKAERNDLSDLKNEFVLLQRSKSQFDTWLMRLTWAVIICGVLRIAFFPLEFIKNG